MKFGKNVLAFSLLYLVSGCNGASTPTKQLPDPYVEVAVPQNWSYLDQQSWGLLPEPVKANMLPGTVQVAFDEKSPDNLQVVQEPLFAEFSVFKKNYQESYPVENNNKLDFKVTGVSELTVAGVPALKINASYRKAWPLYNEKGEQTALVSRMMQVVSLALNWPAEAATIINCEAENGRLCQDLEKGLKTHQPDLSVFLKAEPFKTADYQVTVPEGWYQAGAGLSPEEVQKLPPKVRSLYNSEEDVSLISPDSNYLITLNKVEVSLPLEDDQQLAMWLQGVFQNVAAKTAVPGTNLGVTMRNGLQVGAIEGLAFRKENPAIMTKLAYVLNNGFVVGITCTYHQANQDQALARCQQVIDSLVFSKPPLRLVDRQINEAQFSASIPNGWFAFKGRAGDDLQRAPEYVQKQYNADNVRSWQFINRDMPVDNVVELINLNYAGETIDFGTEAMGKLEESVAKSFGNNYQNINKVAATNLEIGGRPAHITKWNYQLANGIVLNSWQTFVACDRGTVISTCTFQQSEEERVGAQCLGVSNSITCK